LFSVKILLRSAKIGGKTQKWEKKGQLYSTSAVVSTLPVKTEAISLPL